METNIVGIKSQVLDKITKALNIHPAVDALPSKVVNSIQPVLDVEPEKRVICVHKVETDGTSKNLLVCSSTRRTFLIGCGISVSKDAANASIFSSVSITGVDGATANLINLRYEPSTAGQFKEYICFPFPIEIKKGTTITMNNSDGTASIDLSGVLYYYEEDEQ